MSGALLSGRSYGLGIRSILFPSLNPPFKHSRAASLNSAIGRGLRKSKGVGFRGKERSETRNGGVIGERRNNALDSFVRRTADPPVQSSITREGARAPFRHERRAAARAGQDAGGVAMRLRVGKKELKDPRASPPKRSRAARFNDPSHSFGKRSLPVEQRQESQQSRDEDYDHDIEEVRESRRLGLEDGKQPRSGRKRPIISTARQRAADSDRIAIERNPDGSKLSKSRLAYLSKTVNGPQNPENHIHRPPREPYNLSREKRNLTSRPGLSRADQETTVYSREAYHSIRGDVQSRFDMRGTYQSVREDREVQASPREPYRPDRDDRKPRTNTRDGPRSPEPKKHFGFKLDSSTSTLRPNFTQTQDNRYPLTITYTTPASEFLYGTSVVEAALLSRRNPRRKLYKLYVYTGENRENAERDAAMEKLAKKNKIDIVPVDTNNIRLLDKMSSGRPHNGYVLESSPLPRLPITALGEITGKGDREGFSVALDYQSREDAAVNGTESFIPTPRNFSGRKPFVLFLDSIVDPGNLGGIIRTASFLGVTAIAISTKNSASFTPVVLKASAGASENVTLFSVSKPAGFISDSKLNGWKVYAAVAPSSNGSSSVSTSRTTDELHDPLSDEPCILMLGNEGEGLRWNLRSKADIELAIRGGASSRGVDSLNVSVAAGILCSAFLKRHYSSSHWSNKANDGMEILPADQKIF